ncbi:hydroxymethylbilane synthase [Candidatus Pelagibacter bacterium]|nr:hydroxymethylbilane synthase [Candidatus Pelagibacter bacterium]
MTKITIGARSSKLSLAYVAKVKELLLKNNNDLKEENINFKAIKTSGDLNLNKKISEIGGKNLFCKEIEESLLKKEIDIAVHSLKDMEANENESLLIGAYLKRNDYRDVIISEKIKNISDLKNGVKIGSSSKRRELQLKKINSNISVINIRGNIDTRINKINENKLDGVILAAAGVKSLKLDKKISLTFNCDHILPAVGQGIIAVQCRKEDKIKNLIKRINDNTTNLCAIAERKMLQTIGGDCDTAIGGLAEIENHNLKLKAQLFSDSGQESFEYELTGREVDASFIGRSVGEKLLNLAGKKFKKK